MKKTRIAVAIVVAIHIVIHLATRDFDAPGLLKLLHGG